MRVEVIESKDGNLGKHEAGSPRLYVLGEGYMLRCHNCGLGGFLHDHTVIFDENKLVTITPSLICPGCGAHYHITKGEVVP